MSLVLHRSNRIENLSIELGRLLQSSAQADQSSFSLETLLQAETVVVSSMGMQRWLSMSLANHLGISSNIHFPFPTRTIQEILLTTEGSTDLDMLKQWLPQNLAWHILAELDKSLDNPVFQTLKGYLHQDNQAPSAIGRTHYILARRIADVFDKYLTYRPEMVLEWEASPSQHQDDWQPLLWNQLRNKLSGPHVATLAANFLSQSIPSSLNLSNLPPRLILFGLSTFPPLWVDVLNKLSDHIPVHLFLLCASRQYWGHISSKREIAVALRKQSNQEIVASELYLEEGNPLLSSFGRVGRDFQCILEGPTALEGYQDAGDELFDEPDAASPTLLTLLQRDILDLRFPQKEANENDPRFPPAHPISENDNSVQFHSCHGALRQVEVLRDRLLGLLNDNTTLDPRDILVLTTDIEKYAPLISAVFSEGDSLENGTIPDHSTNGFPRLPFSIADRSLEKLNPVAECLVKVLELGNSRVTSTKVMELLNHAPIRNKFDIAFSDIPRLRQWVADGAVRWGIDAEHKKQQGHPNARPTSFEFGIDRLVLGYVFENEALFGDALSTTTVGGNEASLLEKLTSFCQALFTTLQSLQVPQNTEAWCQTLRLALQSLMQTESNEEWLTHQVLQGIDSLAQAAEGAQNETALELGALQAALSEHFIGTPEYTSFLSGGITCCALIPMRSIPFRVVCFLGMDDTEFPRKPAALGFDLTAQNPRLGDRNPRDDDRYLFLESLLSARENIIICYTGRGIRDNKPSPPAVPIGELQDCIERSFVPVDDPSGSVLSRILHEHPLQGFSPAAFRGDSIGFHRAYLAGAKHLLEKKHQAPEFLEAPLDEVPQPESFQVSLEQLSRFLQNPSATFLNHRLGLSYFDQEIALEDATPVALDGLEKWKVGTHLCGLESAGLSTDEIITRLNATGQVPGGTLGDVALENLIANTSPLTTAANAFRKSEATWVDIHFDLPPQTSLFGRITNIFDGRRVDLQYGKIKGKHLLNLWTLHLALQAHPEQFGSTLFFARNNKPNQAPSRFEFLPLGADATTASNNATIQLQSLGQLYQLGHQQPLPLFAQSSWAYAKEVLKDPEDTKLQLKGRNQAKKQWSKNNKHLNRREGDITEPAIHRIYEGHHPYEANFTHPALSQEGSLGFEALALRVWAPLLHHLKEEKLR